MSSPRFIIKICLLFLLLAASCNGGGEESIIAEEGENPATPPEIFEQVREAEGARNKIALLNRALSTVESRSDTIIPDLLDYKIYYHTTIKEFDSALYFADSLVQISQFLQDTIYEARGHYRKSRAHYDLGEQEEVYRNAYRSRQLYLAAGDSSQAGRRSMEMANAQDDLGDLTGSQETATEALRLLDPKKDSVYISGAYNGIAIAYRKQGFYQDALKEFDNALRFAVSRRDSLAYMNNKALVYRDMLDFPMAILIFERVLQKVDPGNENSLVRYRDNLTYTQWLQDPGSAEVESQLIEALQTRKENNDRSGLLASYDHLADFYEERDEDRARRYAEELLKISSDEGAVSSELEALKKLIRLAPSAESRRYVDRYMKLDDSLNSAVLTSKNTFAKIRFDEEQKLQQISRLEALSARQTLETERLRNQQVLGVLVTLLIILGTSFVFYYFRQLHKKEKVREVQKTESRISKVIHDELANDIYNIMSSLEAVVPSPVVDKLERIYHRTRDISRENSDIDTGGNYVQNLIGTLGNIAKGNVRLIVRGENAVAWDRIAEEKKIVIYRVLQELMINMKKHSEARLVAVVFSREGKNLVINYTDTGKGCNPRDLKKGNGLQNIQSRISSVNGRINFETETEKGFKAEISIPA